MLGKLMKYEFKATGRVFLPLYAALIVVSLVNRLLALLPVYVPRAIGTILSVLLIIGIAVITLILTFQRFRKNILSNEGYLMMTLPVSTDSIILSKLFVAAIWYVVSSIVVILSILIMALSDFSLSDLGSFFEGVGSLFGYISTNPAYNTIFIIEIIIVAALSLFSGILWIYACMALSMMVNKRRGLFTFGAFVVISTALQILGAVLATIINATGIDDWIWRMSLDAFGTSQIVILVLFIVEAALCAAFYFITRHMLRHRLNLQ